MNKKNVCWCIFINCFVSLLAMGQGMCVDELRAQAGAGHWAVYTNNPILRPGAKGEWDAGALGSMTVLKVGEVFHMYYEAWGVRGNNAGAPHGDYSSLQIGHATSRDGVNWVKDPVNPVLPKGVGSDWDRDGTWDPFVLHEDGIFKMWYGGGLDGRSGWGYAVSSDGANFQKKGRLATPAADLNHVEDDHVVHDKTTGHYFMYYWDRKREPAGLYCAESVNETNFNFAHAMPITIEGLKYPAMYKFPHVIQENGRWHMFFGEFVRPGCKGCHTGYATSSDGLHWTANNTNLLVGQDGEVFKVADDLWLQYYGLDGFFDQAGCDIRVALFKGKLDDLAGTKAQSEPLIENIIVAYKTHFDIGFTELASTVIHHYRTDFVDRCLKIMEGQTNLPSNQRFTWIVPGWPLEKMIGDWGGQTDERRKRLLEALQNDKISPHALSFSTHTGTMDLEELVRTLGPSYRVSQKAGKPLSISGKMTDVPGHTWVLPTVLHAAGIKFMHIGCNDNSAPCQVPPLFWWEGPDGSRVLTVYAPLYSFGILPPKNWKSKTWLALIMTSDNQGPPSSLQFSNDMKTLRTRFPKANIRTGTMDDFARLVIEENPELPVVKKDLADSWICGTMSMPTAVIAARIARALTPTAEFLETYLAANGVEAFPVSSQAIYDDTARFAEHTWGADYKKFYSENGPGPKDGAAKHRYGTDWQEDQKKYPSKKLVASWEEKSTHAYRAEAASLKAVSENMHRLAASVNVQGSKVVVFNPLPYERDGFVYVDAPGTFSGQLKNLLTGAIAAVKKSDSGFCFLAEGVPASGYVTYVPVKEKTSAGSDLAVDEKGQTIENQFFKLRFSPETGSIASIIEKSSGTELVDHNSSYKFGQYLYERFSQKDLDRYNSQYIRSAWAHLDHMRSHLPPEVPHLDFPATDMKLAIIKDEISVSGTLSGTPDIASKIPEKYRAGLVYAKRIEIKVTLFSDKPFIDISWSIDGKQEEPWPEAGWLCFPLKTEKPEYRLGALGSVVNPATDIVTGADNDMYCVSDGIAVKDGNNSVVINPVDSPMVCLGYPKLWYHHKTYETPPESTVFVNLFNNCWGTNFREWTGGSWSSRIRISRCADYQDGAGLKSPSREIRLPLQGIMTSASGGKLPAHGSGITLSRKDVYMTTYGKNPFGEGMILRLWDQSGKDGDCEIIFPNSQAPASLVSCDLYSRPNGQTVTVKDGRCTVFIGRNAPASFMLR